MQQQSSDIDDQVAVAHVAIGGPAQDPNAAQSVVAWVLPNTSAYVPVDLYQLATHEERGTGVTVSVAYAVMRMCDMLQLQCWIFNHYAKPINLENTATSTRDLAEMFAQPVSGGYEKQYLDSVKHDEPEWDLSAPSPEACIMRFVQVHLGALTAHIRQTVSNSHLLATSVEEIVALLTVLVLAAHHHACQDPTTAVKLRSVTADMVHAEIIKGFPTGNVIEPHFSFFSRLLHGAHELAANVRRMVDHHSGSSQILSHLPAVARSTYVLHASVPHAPSLLDHIKAWARYGEHAVSAVAHEGEKLWHEVKPVLAKEAAGALHEGEKLWHDAAPAVERGARDAWHEGEKLWHEAVPVIERDAREAWHETEKLGGELVEDAEYLWHDTRRAAAQLNTDTRYPVAMMALQATAQDEQRPVHPQIQPPVLPQQEYSAPSQLSLPYPPNQRPPYS